MAQLILELFKIILLLGFVIFILLCLIFLICQPDSKPKTQVIRDITEARKVLRESSLEERSHMNSEFMTKRFGIENELTTLSQPWRRESLRQTINSIKTSDDEWRALVNQSNLYLQKSLSEIRRGDSVPLRSFVQRFVFRIAMLKVYPTNKLAPTEEDLEVITSNIIGLHNLPDGQRIEIEFRKETLVSRVGRVFGLDPDGNIPARENPLNQLFVAFDAMQRVVLRCFLELGSPRWFLNHPFSSGKIEQWPEFLENPNKHTFEQRGLLDFSLKDAINEALRLYPPPTSIFRQIKNEIIEIDVEYIHRDPSNWGASSWTYNPTRWQYCDMEKVTFIPFSTGRIACPTRGSMGPRLLEVLVATLLHNIGQDFELIGEGSDEILKDPAPLQASRQAYPNVGLMRKNA
ncbi:hypothetical protein EG329_005728 [Mollisiaceae sp. DMI_Dod_QoI]|nr:hypothetical protein EG329_005728 [Helotiales sp. DMI_Dod_QoI]